MTYIMINLLATLTADACTQMSCICAYLINRSVYIIITGLQGRLEAGVLIETLATYGSRNAS